MATTYRYDLEFHRNTIAQIGDRYEENTEEFTDSKLASFATEAEAVALMHELLPTLAAPRVESTSRGLDKVAFESIECVKVTLDEDGDDDEYATVGIVSTLSDADRETIRKYERDYWRYLDDEIEDYGPLELSGEVATDDAPLTVTVNFFGQTFDIHRTRATATFEGATTHVWIDDDEIPNEFITNTEGEFVELNGDNAWKLKDKQGFYYMAVMSDEGKIAYVDIDPASDGYRVNGDRLYDTLGKALEAARHPQSARNRAASKYRKDKVKQVVVRLYPADADIEEHLDSIDEPRATYIKRLIREDMERR